MNAAQVTQLEKVFKSFDVDGSGAISKAEVESVVSALGLALSKLEVEEMISEADSNKSGEIEFPEFQKVMEAHIESMGKNGQLGPFGALIQRKERTGPPLMWTDAKLGDAIRLEDEKRVVQRDAAHGWGVQLCDSWLSSASGQYNMADMTLEVEELTDGNVYVGAVGRNYYPAAWNAPLNDSRHAVVVSLAKGEIWRKEVKSELMLGAVQKGDRVHLNLDMLRQSLTIDLLTEGNAIARSVTVDGVPPESTVCVCLGPGAQKVRIVGSSTEMASSEYSGKSNKDLWDDDNVQKLSDEKKQHSESIEAIASSLE